MPEQTWDHFPQHELDCPCGCDGRMSNEFMDDVVVPMRKALGFVFVIPNGGAYRCADYDGKDNGAHQGHALDVVANSRQKFLILDWIFKRNHRIDNGTLRGRKITRIGINRGSIHFDDMIESEGKDCAVIWDYYK